MFQVTCPGYKTFLSGCAGRSAFLRQIQIQRDGPPMPSTAF